MREAGCSYQQLFFPINEMLPKENPSIGLDESLGWYESIFEALTEGGSVLVVCKNGMHRSRREGSGERGKRSSWARILLVFSAALASRFPLPRQWPE